MGWRKLDGKKTHGCEFLIIFKKNFIIFFYFVGIFDLYTNLMMMNDLTN